MARTGTIAKQPNSLRCLLFPIYRVQTEAYKYCTPVLYTHIVPGSTAMASDTTGRSTAGEYETRRFMLLVYLYSFWNSDTRVPVVAIFFAAS